MHKYPVGDGRFNCVAIIDAIPEGELNTAKSNYETIRDIAEYTATGLHARYFRADSIGAVEAAILSLKSEVISNGIIPWVHLEGHGAADESGFLTSDQTLCTWSRLKDMIVPLNVATDLNLLLILATCFGGSFARAITTVDRAPVLGLIGPTREITAGEVEVDFPSFYRTFFSTNSLHQAINALTARASPGLYYCTSAEKFFYSVWAGYKVDACSSARVDQRARAMYRELKARNLSRTPSIGKLKRLVSSEEEGQFQKYCETYFMYDINPKNRDRFSVTYQKAEAYAARQL